MGLLLTVADVEGPWRWRWLLTDEETGQTLAEHRVRLAEHSPDELAAFRDLYGYTRWRSAPDRLAGLPDQAQALEEREPRPGGLDRRDLPQPFRGAEPSKKSMRSNPGPLGIPLRGLRRYRTGKARTAATGLAGASAVP